MKLESIQKVSKYFKSQKNLAQALCVTQGAVSQWLSAGYFPAERAIQIEIIMGSRKVKAADLIK